MRHAHRLCAAGLALVAAGLMIASGCVTAHAARLSINWTLLLTIAATIGIGTAFAETGLDHALASGILAAGGNGPVAALTAVFVGTALLSLIVTNNAAAVLSFPVASYCSLSASCTGPNMGISR